jgi:DNA repair exonuclease SbcCD nuclease subunit
VHTSDVHLGAYGSLEGRWAERRRLMETAFSGVIDLGIESGAQALLIAGDFFDNDRVDRATVEFAAAQVRRFPGEAFLVPGNHDPMDPGTLYWRHDLEAMAPNLRIFREHAGQYMEAKDCDLVLWGRAYLDSDWHFRPLDGLPVRIDRRWHIVMAHGHFVRENGEMHRSMLIRESEVEAAASDWDYMALGHWEPHADVSSGGMTAIYSGAPMPLSDANQKAGWAVVLDLDRDGPDWRLHRVDPRGLP